MPRTCQFDHPLLAIGTHCVFDWDVLVLNALEGLTHEDCRMYALQCMAIRNLVGRINRCSGDFPIRPYSPVLRNTKASNHPKRLVYNCWKAGSHQISLWYTSSEGHFDLLVLNTARLKAARDFPKRLYKSHPWCKCAGRRSIRKQSITQGKFSPAPNQRGLRKTMLDHEQFARRITPMTQDRNTTSSVIGALSYCELRMSIGKIAVPRRNSGCQSSRQR